MLPASKEKRVRPSGPAVAAYCFDRRFPVLLFFGMCIEIAGTSIGLTSSLPALGLAAAHVFVNIFHTLIVMTVAHA